MKKKWKNPTIVKIDIKKITLSGAGKNDENKNQLQIDRNYVSGLI